ncbi:hypothetical protein SCP_0102090 [Sparassis crispa]|uniref:Uncharacterized protein n=1 Tax=Sparassis crispa TaxID=139825 RepID=A0A401G591_9APHY|nr:hypothetical protein SCP_0102090 [Sparassis crispa]GBE77336.1 hypothetical protein SCP_0102090 [Sparassis crispa]
MLEAIKHTDAREGVCDKVREEQETGAGCGERGEAGHREELRDSVDSDQDLRRGKVLAEPEEQPARCIAPAMDNLFLRKNKCDSPMHRLPSA